MARSRAGDRLPAPSAIARRGKRCETAQHGFYFIASEGFRQHLPLFRRIDIQRGVVVDQLVEEKVAIEVAKGRQLAAYGTAIDRVGEELLNEVAHLGAAGVLQGAFLPL